MSGGLPPEGFRPVHLPERAGDDRPFPATFWRTPSLCRWAWGQTAWPALNLAIPIYNFIHGSGLMIGMGGGTRYSILQSQGNRREANKVFTHVLYLAAVLAAFFVAVGLLFAGDIVRLFGGAGNVFTMAQTYLRVILLFSPAFLMNNVLLCFVRNDGAPQLSMAAMIGGSLSNVVLDWVFIFPCGMGIFGAGCSPRAWRPSSAWPSSPPHFFRRKNNFHPVACRPQGRTLGRILSSGGALSGDGGLLGDRHHRLQRPHYGPGGQHRRGGLRGDCQPVLGGHRHLHGDRPGHPAHPQPQLRRRG